MYPEIRVASFGVVLHSHTALLATATVIALALGYRRATRVEHLDRGRVALALLAVGSLAFAGGRLHFVLAKWELFRDNPWSAFATASTSMHAPGAVAAAFLGGALVLGRLGLPVGRFADGLAPAACVGIAVARLGCFLNGCCMGDLCRLPWGVTLPAGTYVFAVQREALLVPPGASRSVPVHPLPLYFATAALMIALLLVRLRRRRRYPGQLALLFLALFSACGALLEPLRLDDSFRAYWGGFPQLLWINAAMGVAALGSLVIAGNANRHDACVRGLVGRRTSTAAVSGGRSAPLRR